MNRQHRKIVPRKYIHEAVTQVGKRLERKIKKNGNTTYESMHEIYGIIAEEFHEVMVEMHLNNIETFETELKDVAVAAIWGLASMQTLKENKVY